MKNLLFIAAIVISVASYSQSYKYTSAMKQSLSMFDSAKTAADLETAAASFQRIGDAEKTQWIPYYWQGLGVYTEGWKYYPNEKGVTEVKVSDLSGTMTALAGRINAALDKADAI